MNICIYSTEYPRQVSPSELARLMAAVPPEISCKVQRYKRWQDAYGCLLGKHLLMSALNEMGLAADLGQLQYSNYGKPYLPNAPDFNIAHSGNRVVCIIADKGKAGIDLEEIKEITIDDFKGHFCEEEWEIITEADEPLKVFYYYWTAKESIMKADGRGLNLQPLSLKIVNNTIIQVDDQYWCIRSLPFFNNYACHIATGQVSDVPQLRNLSLAELIAFHTS